MLARSTSPKSTPANARGRAGHYNRPELLSRLVDRTLGSSEARERPAHPKASPCARFSTRSLVEVL